MASNTSLKSPSTNILKDGISVIIPTYKGEKWILKCLESLNKQTLDKKFFEIIVIINGKKDTSEILLDTFQNKNLDLNIIKILLAEASAANARNEGIEKASYQYTTFIDDDDWVSEMFLQSLYSKASGDTIVVGEQIVNIDSEGNQNKSNYINAQIQEVIHLTKITLNDISHIFGINANKLIPTKYIKQLQYDPLLTNGEDVIYFSELMVKFNFNLKVADNTIYYRLVREKSVSRQNISYQFNIIDRLKVIEKLNQLLLETADLLKLNFIKRSINGQVGFINEYLQKNTHDEEKVLKEIKKFNIYYLSMPLLKKPAVRKLIVSYMFPPCSNTNIINMIEKIHLENKVVDVVYNDVHTVVKPDDSLNTMIESYVHKRYRVFSSPAFDSVKSIDSFSFGLLERLNKEDAANYKEVESFGNWMVSHIAAFQYAMEKDIPWNINIEQELFFDKNSERKFSVVAESLFVDKISKMMSKYSYQIPETNNLYTWCWYTILYFANEIILPDEVLLNKFTSKLSVDNLDLLLGKVRIIQVTEKTQNILNWRKLMKQTVDEKILNRIENEFIDALSSKQITIDNLNTDLNELHSKHLEAIEDKKSSQKELNLLHIKHLETIEDKKSSQKELNLLHIKYSEAIEEKKKLKVELNTLHSKHYKIWERTKEQESKIKSCYNSASYKLGYLLMHETRSVSDVLKLFKRILKIKKNRESERQKEQGDEYKTEVKNLTHSHARISWPSFVKPSFTRTRDLNIAVIMDTFTFESFSYEAKLTKLRRKDWEKQLEENSFDFLFLESAWSGNDDEWKFMMMNLDKPFAEPLIKLIEAVKRKNIPIVFWNKEDPTNFEDFISMASLCEYIFTTDSDSIGRYKEILKHDKIYSLPFAAQPQIHNPIKQGKLKDYEVCFAGSWYDSEAFADRQEFTRLILDGAIKHELHIFDRMYGEKGHKNRIFPEIYQPYIKGKLSYDEMLTAYRQYKVFLNINTIHTSPTMFSRRVFELMACKTAVVSTPSQGIDNLLGNHVRIVSDKKETDIAISNLLENESERKRKNHLAYRHIMEHHTYHHRFHEILDKLPIEKPLKKEKSISVVTITNRVDYIDNIIENMQRQKFKNFQLILVLNSNEFDLDQVKEKFSILKNDVQIFTKDDSISLGECFNFAFTKTNGDYIAKMDDDDLYGAHYLTDTLLTFQYSNADIVGKKSVYVYFEGLDKTFMKYPNQEDRYADFITGPTIVFKREVMDEVKFIDANKSEDSNFLIDAKAAGYKIFSSDAFNFIYMRRSVNNSHTWKIDVEKFLRTCEEVGKGIRTDEAFI